MKKILKNLNLNWQQMESGTSCHGHRFRISCMTSEKVTPGNTIRCVYPQGNRNKIRVFKVQNNFTECRALSRFRSIHGLTLTFRIMPKINHPAHVRIADGLATSCASRCEPSGRFRCNLQANSVDVVDRPQGQGSNLWRRALSANAFR